MERVVPQKSPTDPKDYLGLILTNGLKLLIVSDLECDKTAVSVSIGTGSMSDPEDIPGLAHLCEHLLSVEVNRPGQKPFNMFIAENGGMFNAFTTRDQTNFHFDVGPLAFENAFKKFVNFFITTTVITEKDIQREILIVDSEHQTKVNNDSWRKMAVDACTAKKGHPFQKFTTGNKRTLCEVPADRKINLLKAAIEFRSNFYVSRLMTVVVYGKQSLSSLENLCVPLLSKVPDRENAKVSEWSDWPFGTGESTKRIDIVSLADIRDFYVTFPIPNMRPFYKTFPMGYITRLLGARGPGSLYSYLYDKHWVEFSYINSSIPARGFGELSVGFQLTQLGMEFVDEIVLHIFQYIKMLKRTMTARYFWEEMKQVLGIQFTYQEREVPVDFVQRMSNLMHVYPLQDVLIVGSVISEYDPQIIEKFANCLEVENCRVITVCKDNEQKGSNFILEPWYGTKFMLRQFSVEELQSWKFCELNDNFYLPKPNKFIPTDFSLKYSEKSGEADSIPVLIIDSPLGKVWFQQDNNFKTAKGVIRLEIFSPLPMSDPVLYNINQIWFLTLKNIIGEEFYQATVAGCYSDIKPVLNGAEITVSGFSDKLMSLLYEIIVKIASKNDHNAIINHFNNVKQRYATSLKNWRNFPMQNASTYLLSLLLREKRYSNDELLEALDDTSEEDLENYMQSFFNQSHYEWMVYGNFTSNEANSVVKSCKDFIKSQWKCRPLLSCQNVRFREVCLEPGISHVFETLTHQSGSSCAILLQVGVLNLRDSMCLEIIDQIIFEPLFTHLRNQEQIGYIVRSSVRKSNGCHGLLIFVQSNKHPEYLSGRIFKALKTIGDGLAEMNAADFNQQKNSIRIRKVEKPKTMLIYFNKVWNNEIYPRRYDFNRVATELQMLDNIDQDEVVRFYQERLSDGSKERRVLQIWLNSPTTIAKTDTGGQNCNWKNSSTIVYISDVQKWKLRMNLWKLENK